MIFYSQRDPAWAEIAIPGTNLSIGRWGCVITGIADIAVGFGMKLTPRDVALHCRFTSGGLIWWSSCVFEKFIWRFRQYGRKDEEIRAALDDPHQAVILQVANASHWVVAIGYDKIANLFIVADPWIGDMTSMARYKNSITGASYFKRK